MTAKIKVKKGTPPKKDAEEIKKNLEKTGEAVGAFFGSIFKGVGKILDIAQEMEEKGQEVKSHIKKIKGVTRTGKEFQGEAGWRIKTGILDESDDKENKEDREETGN